MGLGCGLVPNSGRGRRDEKALPAPLQGSPPWSPTDWGGAAPLCGPAGLQPAFPQSHARWLSTRRGPGRFQTAGLEKGDLGLQSLNHPTLPIHPRFPARSLSARSPQLGLRVGQGRRCPGLAPRLLQLLSPGRAASSQGPGAPPWLSTPGHQALEPGGTGGTRPAGDGGPGCGTSFRPSSLSASWIWVEPMKIANIWPV